MILAVGCRGPCAALPDRRVPTGSSNECTCHLVPHPSIREEEASPRPEAKVREEDADGRRGRRAMARERSAGDRIHGQQRNNNHSHHFLTPSQPPSPKGKAKGKGKPKGASKGALARVRRQHEERPQVPASVAEKKAITQHSAKRHSS